MRTKSIWPTQKGCWPLQSLFSSALLMKADSACLTSHIPITHSNNNLNCFTHSANNMDVDLAVNVCSLYMEKWRWCSICGIILVCHLTVGKNVTLGKHRSEMRFNLSSNLQRTHILLQQHSLPQVFLTLFFTSFLQMQMRKFDLKFDSLSQTRLTLSLQGHVRQLNHSAWPRQVDF